MTEMTTSPESASDVQEVMLFRDARGWGVSATVGRRSRRHWRFHTERQARFMAAVLELGPRVLPAGSSGSRRHARLLGMREGARPRPSHCGRGSTPWPGGPATTQGPCEGSAVPAGRFGSLAAALETGLSLAASAPSRRPTASGGADLWNPDGSGEESLETCDSLGSALDAALDRAFDEEADCLGGGLEAMNAVG